MRHHLEQDKTVVILNKTVSVNYGKVRPMPRPKNVDLEELRRFADTIMDFKAIGNLEVTGMGLESW